MAEGALLRVNGLSVSFAGARVVDDVSLSVRPGETVAVVGESGSGKSVTALSIIGLLPAAARVESGVVEWGDPARDLMRLSSAEQRAVRGREIAMVFQEPMTSLNPVMSIGEQLVETLETHGLAKGRAAKEAAGAALAEVGIVDAPRRLRQYPHEFSGGMRQRVLIAMALACRPRLLIADEPTTALDAAVRTQVLDLIGALQRSRGLGVLLITHDLALVARRADTVHVMYAGRIVESAVGRELFERPAHPYTRCLLACVPRPGSHGSRLATMSEAMQREEPSDAAGRRAWWPESGDSEMVEIGAGHAVRFARTP